MDETPTERARLLLDTKSVLGEGPVWDFKKQSLFWVDIEGYKLHAYEPSTEKIKSWEFDEMIGAAVPTKNENLLLAMEKGLQTFDLAKEQLTKLHVMENLNHDIRFNDGKVGPASNFWIGTMDKSCAPKAGNFFRLNSRLQSKLKIEKTSVSNGMAWTADNKTMYYIDSPTFKVRAFDFENGDISNPKTAIEIPEDYGSPDGMSIDENDMLWIAHWGGSCVRQWNPKTGKMLLKIDVDAPHITSCCFGGEDLKTLYITSARSGLTKEELEQHPASGGLFVFETAVKGTPINYF